MTKIQAIRTEYKKGKFKTFYYKKVGEGRTEKISEIEFNKLSVNSFVLPYLQKTLL